MVIDWNRYRVVLHEVGRSSWDKGKVPENLAPGFVTADHDLWVPNEGHARVLLATGWKTMNPGECIWLRPGVRYRVEGDPDGPFRLSFLHFMLEDRRGRAYPDRGPLPSEAIEPPDGAAAETLARRIVDLCFGFDPHGMEVGLYSEPAGSIAAALLTGLLMELDGAVSAPDRRRLPRDQEARIRAAAIRIAENPAGLHPVAELAGKAGYSRNHFTVLFQRLTGHTPERYAVLCRLQRASQLLAATDLDVGEIATQLGYSDIYGFSHQFKKFKGVAPLVWRCRHAGKISQAR